MEEPKALQEPQDHSDHHDGVQNRLNGARHRDETIDEPEQNSNHNQSYNYMN
jgi:hypothetical protein